MKVRLFRELHEHRDGKIIRHPAGSTPDLPEHVANYVNESVIQQRVNVREIAKRYPGTPESK